ncbi:winged helix-turn-helix transcriptional regulator [Streptococcus dentiloxodontae]
MLTNKEWNCSMSKVLDVVGGKWRMNVLWVIHKHQTIRFNQLQREVLGITRMSLTRALEALMKEGLVGKIDLKTMPLHTEYYLSSKGRSLLPILKDLNQWGRIICLDCIAAELFLCMYH